MSVIQKICIWAIPVLFAITVHEVAHGWVALKFGDKTAQIMGRLTLNPLKHIDLVGTVILPILMIIFTPFIFGWAKPVPVSQNHLRHPRRDMAIVALAGPASNLVMALIWALIMKFGIFLANAYGGSFAPIAYMGQAGIVINLILMYLNLIPLPPLDGGRVVSNILPPKVAYQYDRIEPFGFIILIVLLVSGVLGSILLPLISHTQALIVSLFGMA